MPKQQLETARTYFEQHPGLSAIQKGNKIYDSIVLPKNTKNKHDLQKAFTKDELTKEQLYDAYDYINSIYRDDLKPRSLKTQLYNRRIMLRDVLKQEFDETFVPRQTSVGKPPQSKEPLLTNEQAANLAINLSFEDFTDKTLQQRKNSFDYYLQFLDNKQKPRTPLLYDTDQDIMQSLNELLEKQDRYAKSLSSKQQGLAKLNAYLEKLSSQQKQSQEAEMVVRHIPEIKKFIQQTKKMNQKNQSGVSQLDNLIQKVKSRQSSGIQQHKDADSTDDIISTTSRAKQQAQIAAQQAKIAAQQAKNLKNLLQ